jgi:hypothetical protein
MGARCAYEIAIGQAVIFEIGADPKTGKSAAVSVDWVWRRGFRIQTKHRPKAVFSCSYSSRLLEQSPFARVRGDPISRCVASEDPSGRAPEPIGQTEQPAADCVSPSAAGRIAKGGRARKNRHRRARNIVSRWRQLPALRSARWETSQRWRRSRPSRRWWRNRGMLLAPC